MQVLIVTNQYVKEDKGSYYCIENLYDILSRFSLIGKLHICAQKFAGKSSNIIDSKLDGLIDTQDIHFVSKTFIRTDSRSKKIIEDCVKKVDLVIGYVPNTNATTACKLAKKHNKKFMSYVVACVWDALWNHGLAGKFLAPYKFFNTRFCIKNSDFALYVTEHFLQKRYPCPGLTCGCSDVKITNTDESVLESRIKRVEQINSNSTINLVTIANNSVRYKGQHFVIRALAKLKKSGCTQYHYYLIGGGNKDWLERLAKSLDVFDQVHFEGIVPHQKVFEKLDEMHVYIQPSLQEGLPRSVVEAMSRGLLCICANTAAMPELVDSEYVVRRKSVDDIVDVLQNISQEKLIEQAKRNFSEAKKYCEFRLNEKRNAFFDSVRKDCEG